MKDNKIKIMINVEKRPPIMIYDTTLRDGAQGRGVNFSVGDRIKALQWLDHLGFPYIEGGFVGASSVDTTFFKEAQNLSLKSTLVSFGSTRRADVEVGQDASIRALLDAGTPACAIVGKASLWQVTEILRTSPDENIRMVTESIEALKKVGKEVVFDAEHLFDGFKYNPEYTLRVLRESLDAGADWIVLCDTKGGQFPIDIKRITWTMKQQFPKAKIGIHTHNDRGLAVINAQDAVEVGATQVQGTINGYGERTGNANLLTLIPNLTELGYDCIDPEKMFLLTKTRELFDQLSGRKSDPSQPYVGEYAFSHKAGYHANGQLKNPSAYENTDPMTYGNSREIPLSLYAGAASVKLFFLRHSMTVSDENARIILNYIKAQDPEQWRNLDDDPDTQQRFLEKYVPLILGDQPKP